MFFSSLPLVPTFVVTGVSPDDPVQVDGDSTGSIVGGFAGAGVGSCGSLIASAPLVKPMKALDGTVTDPDGTCARSIDGVAVGWAAGVIDGTLDGLIAGSV